MGGYHGHTNGLQVWDVRSGKEILCVIGSLGPSHAHAPAFSPDGKTVAAVREGRAVQVWDLATGQPARKYDQAAGSVRALCFTPEGKLLVLAVEEKSINLWELTAGKKLHALGTTEKPFVPVAFSRDGRAVAFRGAEKAISVRGTATGKELHRLEEHAEFIYSLTFSTDGKTLVSASQDGMRLWDLDRGEERLKLAPAPGMLGVLSPDGKTLATSGAGHVTRFWDATTGKPLEPFPGHTGPVSSIAVSPDGKLAATAAWLRGDPVVRLWEVTTGRQVREFRGPPGGASGVAFSPDGRWLASSGWWGDAGVRVWDVQTAKELRVLKGHRGGVGRLTLSPDGKRLASAEHSQNQEGKYEGRILIWDPATGERVHEIGGFENQIEALAFAEGGRTLLVASNGVHFWDMATGRRRGEPLLPKGMVGNLAVSPDGKVMATVGHTSPARLWEVATRREVLQLPAAFRGYPVAFAPNGRVLAVGGEGFLRLFDWPTEREVFNRTGLQRYVGALAFAPDGNFLLSGSSWETSALVWDVAGVASGPFPPAPEARRETVGHWWDELRDGDAAAAYRAVWNLVSVPGQTVPLLRASLKPAAGPDPVRVTRLIADLNADRFEVREQATRELEQLGEAADGPLSRALRGNPPAEQRRRLQGLLEKLQDPRPAPDELRGIRAVAVLEQIGSPEARKLLEELAGGAPEARLTRDAKSALQRLSNRPAALPERR